MEIGDRMKYYEKLTQTNLSPLLPVMVRLDGKNFSKWTKGLDKPYDKKFCKLMQDTTEFLIKQTNAVLGYTQSDEITLCLYSDNFESQTFFNGRVQKLCSVLSSFATGFFNKNSPFDKPLAFFDCRVWNVPNSQEAANVFLWRELDATRNSILSAAQTVYSHKEMMNKKTDVLQEMLFQKGINWNNYPSYFKRGAYLRKTQIEKELNGQKCIRSNIQMIEFPLLMTMENKLEIFKSD